MNIIERIQRHIPKGDGYNSEFAHDLSEAVDLIEALTAERDELRARNEVLKAKYERDLTISRDNSRWYQTKYYEHLTQIITPLRDLLIRYRNEIPVGNQPYMICHEVDKILDATSPAKEVNDAEG